MLPGQVGLHLKDPRFGKHWIWSLFLWHPRPLGLAVAQEPQGTPCMSQEEVLFPWVSLSALPGCFSWETCSKAPRFSHWTEESPVSLGDVDLCVRCTHTWAEPMALLSLPTSRSSSCPGCPCSALYHCFSQNSKSSLSFQPGWFLTHCGSSLHLVHTGTCSLFLAYVVSLFSQGPRSTMLGAGLWSGWHWAVVLGFLSLSLANWAVWGSWAGGDESRLPLSDSSPQPNPEGGRKGLEGASVLSTLVSGPGAKPGDVLTPRHNFLPSFVEDKSTHISLFNWDTQDASFPSPPFLIEQQAPALDLL